VTASAHNRRELKAAEQAGADLVFLSPVFPTRSHPGARPLGAGRFSLLAHQVRLPVIALGGMNAAKARRLSSAHGWAGIDAWSEG
jgi:thiamine-phosphate pyrophosphorylase